MENFYLIVIIALFGLAISDLIVGVSNDAVNFLNSAIGSKVVRKWVIYLVAGLGVFIGATFSNGMMEVARKGIFHPDMFFFTEIMIIFMAVMITDVILLDLFNTYGLPTSTTVSLVFELLGAAVAVSMVKIYNLGGIASDISSYINSDKALAIISGILISIVIAFVFGALVQYIVRFLFSFNYKKPMKYFGSVFGGLSITFIVYFILIKGIDGSAFADFKTGGELTLSDWMGKNTRTVLIFSFTGITIFLQLLKWIFDINILKWVILSGTFALAMAFAGNDLVNFIGVPLAGFAAFNAWTGSGLTPDGMTMEMLGGEVETPSYMLLISGFIMVLTLILSKKAKSVTETEVNLGRQNEGDERFESSQAARFIVRFFSNSAKNINRLIPARIALFIESRFVPVSLGALNDPRTPAFDELRAAVNLVLASVLIAFGTSLKLPLSTTYVTFMVAMASSLSDRAWDRDSAVYRISGVFTVVGGWFLTAVFAFFTAGFIALIISISGKYMIFVFLIIAVALIVKSHLIFRKRTKDTAGEDLMINENDLLDQVVNKSTKQVVGALGFSSKIINLAIGNFLNENRSGLKNAQKVCDDFSKKAKKNKDNVYRSLLKITDKSLDTGHFYVQIMDYKREMAHALHFMLKPMAEHTENNHKPFTKEQSEELIQVTKLIEMFNKSAEELTKNEDFGSMNQLIKESEDIFDYLLKMKRTQIKRIKNKDVNIRNSQLFFKIITELENTLLHTVSLIKSLRDFIYNSKQEQKNQNI